MLSNMSALQSALKYLPIYLNTSSRWWYPNDNAHWQLAMRTARMRSNAEPPPMNGLVVPKWHELGVNHKLTPLGTICTARTCRH